MKKYLFTTNVWEWVSDQYSRGYYPGETKEIYIEAENLDRARIELALCYGIRNDSILKVEEVK